MNRKQATNRARKQSKNNRNIEENNRVYVFRHSIESNQYYQKDEYYKTTGYMFFVIR